MTDKEQEKQVMQETLAHKTRVGDLLTECIHDLTKRAVHHDDTKFGDEEFPYFAEVTPKLKHIEYGSEEYKENLEKIKPAIEHHHHHNSHHHPDALENGIEDMGLIDLLEMICDWKAASERHNTGNLNKSFRINVEKYGITPQLEKVMRNTAKRMGWI